MEREYVIMVVVERSESGLEWRRWGREGATGVCVCVQRDEGENRAEGGGGRERGKEEA